MGETSASMVGVNIGSLLTSSAASYPKSPAIVHGSLTMDYEQFNARVNRLSNTVQTFCSSTNW